MGLLYQTMIREILSELPSDLDKVELFLKNKEEKYQETYRIGGALYYLNILEILRQLDLKSEHFESLLKKEESQ
jgi:hypothetical protein